MIIKFTIYRAWHYGDDKDVQIAEREKKIADALARCPNIRQDGDVYYASVEDFFRLKPHLPDNGHTDCGISSFTSIDIDGFLNGAMKVELQLRDIKDRLDEITAATAAPKNSYDEKPLFNNHANSPISGPHLLAINDTCLLEDACTDNLQKHLYDGWRILAVCPQEARRPDYVLGRHIPFNSDISESAERG